MTKQKITSMLVSATGKLAGTYLIIIMVMSIGFSVVFYNTSSNEFSRPIPPGTGELTATIKGTGGVHIEARDIREILDIRFSETQDALLVRLIWINLIALGLGAGLSYSLARWSLRPIEESVEAQNQFVSDASHELRTPLTTLQTSNEVALRKKSLTSTEVKNLLTQNIEESKKLQDLTNALLDLLKDDSKATLTTVNLQDVVADSMASVVSIAQQKSIEIEDKSQNIKVHTEPVLLTRVIAILLDNAVKYSEPHKKISILSAHTNEHIEVTIIDQGIGIKASDLPFIFRRFYRADKSRTSQDSSGYGLGLAIASKMASKINGKLTATSKLGKGSEFKITLNK